AGRELELRLGGQSFTGPSGVGNGILPGDLDRGMVLTAFQVAVRPIRVLPVGVFDIAPPAEMVVERNRTLGRTEYDRAGHKILRTRARKILCLRDAFRDRHVTRGFDELAELFIRDGGA